MAGSVVSAGALIPIEGDSRSTAQWPSGLWRVVYTVKACCLVCGNGIKDNKVPGTASGILLVLNKCTC